MVLVEGVYCSWLRSNWEGAVGPRGSVRKVVRCGGALLPAPPLHVQKLHSPRNSLKQPAPSDPPQAHTHTEKRMSTALLDAISGFLGRNSRPMNLEAMFKLSNLWVHAGEPWGALGPRKPSLSLIVLFAGSRACRSIFRESISPWRLPRCAPLWDATCKSPCSCSWASSRWCACIEVKV